MNTEVYEELRIGPRSLLTAGTKFRASGGPYYESRQPDGSVKQVSMAERGPFVFIRYCERGKRRKWIEAWGRDGYCVLSLNKGGRWPQLANYVRRPYRVTSIIRKRAEVRPTRRGRQSLKRGA